MTGPFFKGRTKPESISNRHAQDGMYGARSSMHRLGQSIPQLCGILEALLVINSQSAVYHSRERLWNVVVTITNRNRDSAQHSRERIVSFRGLAWGRPCQHKIERRRNAPHVTDRFDAFKIQHLLARHEKRRSREMARQRHSAKSSLLEVLCQSEV